MPIAKDVILGIIILALLVQRQLVPRPLSGRLLILPLILGAISLYEAVNNPGVYLASWISLALTMLLSLLVGLIRGRMTRVYQDNGRWMVAGSWKSLCLDHLTARGATTAIKPVSQKGTWEQVPLAKTVMLAYDIRCIRHVVYNVYRMRWFTCSS